MTGRTTFIGQNNDPIPAGATVLYQATFKDETGKPIGRSALTSITLTIVDTVSKAIINGVQDTDILNNDRGTVDDNGNLVIIFQEADMALLNAADTLEERSLIIIWTYNGGSRKGLHQVDFQIQALSGS